MPFGERELYSAPILLLRINSPYIPEGVGVVTRDFGFKNRHLVSGSALGQ